MTFRVASIIAAAVIYILCGYEVAHGQGERGGLGFESAARDAGMTPSPPRESAASGSVCIAATDNENGKTGAAPGAASGPVASASGLANGEPVTGPSAESRAREGSHITVADGTAGDPSTWPCVADILARARSYTRANHFIIPARDNALEAYAEALRVSSRYQKEARAGIEAIKNQYARWATEAERRNDWSGAAAFYRKALAAVPGDGALLAALERAEDHGEEGTAGERLRPAGASPPERVVTRPRLHPEASRNGRRQVAARGCAGAGDPSACGSGESARDETHGRDFLATKIDGKKYEDSQAGAGSSRRLAEARGAIMAAVPAPVAAGPGKRWNVQVTAVRDPEMAIAETAHLRAAGYPAYVATFESLDAAWSRVRVGPFASRVAAARAAASLRARESLPEAFIISD